MPLHLLGWTEDRCWLNVGSAHHPFALAKSRAVFGDLVNDNNEIERHAWLEWAARYYTNGTILGGRVQIRDWIQHELGAQYGQNRWESGAKLSPRWAREQYRRALEGGHVKIVNGFPLTTAEAMRQFVKETRCASLEWSRADRGRRRHITE